MLKTNRRGVVGMSSSRNMAVDPARQYELKQERKSLGAMQLVTCRRCHARVAAASNGAPVWHDRPVIGNGNKTERCTTVYRKGLI